MMARQYCSVQGTGAESGIGSRIMACQGHRRQASNEKLRYHFHLCLMEVVIEMLMPEYL